MLWCDELMPKLITDAMVQLCVTSRDVNSSHCKTLIFSWLSLYVMSDKIYLHCALFVKGYLLCCRLPCFTS